MKLCVLGSTAITDKELIYSALDKFIEENLNTPPTFLVGGAKGVDEIVKQYAKEKERDLIEFVPYHLLDNRAMFTPKFFFIRNKQMIENADACLIFWDKENKGTEYGIKLTQKRNIPYSIVINRRKAHEAT